MKAAILIMLILAGCAADQPQPIQTEHPEFPTITTGSSDEGDVMIDLTPKTKNGMLFVEVAANTHSVDLSQFDLKELATLTYEGKTIKPTTASGLQGHHASGTITFDATPKKFSITIRGIPANETRTYQWT